MSEEIQEEILMIEGPAQGTVFVDGKEVLISTKYNNTNNSYNDIIDDGAHNTGVSTWDGAYELCNFFIRNKVLIENKNILELGSGTGLVGITIALLRPPIRQILLTDLQYTQSQIEQSIILNDVKDNARFHILDWNNQSTIPSSITTTTTTTVIDNKDDIDFIVFADCVWLLHLVEPLVRTIKHINKPFFMAHQSRTTEVDVLFFSLLKTHFHVTLLEERGKIKIYQGKVIKNQKNDDHHDNDDDNDDSRRDSC